MGIYLGQSCVPHASCSTVSCSWLEFRWESSPPLPVTMFSWGFQYCCGFGGFTGISGSRTIGKLLGAKESSRERSRTLGPLSERLCWPYLLSFSEVSQPVIKVSKNKTGEDKSKSGKPLPAPAFWETFNSLETASPVAWVSLRGFMPRLPARTYLACEMWWNHTPRQCSCKRFFFISFHLCSLTLSNNNN